MTTSNAERFLDAYSVIEKAMNELQKTTRYVPFSQLLARCSRSNPIIQQNMETLKEYGELRNSIVHQRGENQEIIAQPTDSVTEDIEKIASLLQTKHDILEYSSKPVQVLSSNDTLQDGLNLMLNLTTSKLPIYDNGKFTGILTMEAIAKYAIANNNAQATAIGQALNAEAHKGKVLFLEKDRDVQDAIEAFETGLKKGSHLLAIIVTEKGNVTEKPLGILTVYDLPKIMDQFM